MSIVQTARNQNISSFVTMFVKGKACSRKPVFSRCSSIDRCFDISCLL